MPTIKIDNHKYELDSLTDAAKAQLQSLKFVEAELARLAAQTAVYQTARIGYIKALRQALQPESSSPLTGDTIKFD